MYVNLLEDKKKNTLLDNFQLASCILVVSHTNNLESFHSVEQEVLCAVIAVGESVLLRHAVGP